MSVPEYARLGGGLIQDLFDPRDLYYTPSSSEDPPASVDLRQDHAEFVTQVFDQGDMGSCTANAATAAFWYEEKAGRRDATWGAAGPARLFLYWLARGGYLNQDHEIENVSDSGSNMRDAMKGLRNVGICKEDDWPYSSGVNDKPDNTAFVNAEEHQINRFYRLDPDRPDENDLALSSANKDVIGAHLLLKLRHCLSEGFPVAFGFWYYLPPDSSFDEDASPFTLTDVWNMPDSQFPRHTFPGDLPEELMIRNETGEIEKPGHSVLAIGYDDEQGAVLVQNSWGNKWSDNGTFWMPYAWITDFAASNDFWTIRGTVQSEAQEAGTSLWADVHQLILGLQNDEPNLSDGVNVLVDEQSSEL